MSFSSLPPELVQQIIESTVPHTFHCTTYQARQQTLCSLSLVSKLFRSISQPLLFEIVKLQNFEGAEKLPTAEILKADVTGSKVVRKLIVAWDSRSDIKPTSEKEDRLARLLKVFATVTSFTIAYLEPESFEGILSMTFEHLTHLHLTDQYPNENREGSGGICLPNLQHLTVWGVSSELLLPLVDPRTVPKLRNFAMVDKDSHFVEDLAKAKLDRLLPQLDTMYFAAGIWSDPRAAFLHSAAFRTLVDFTFNDAAALRLSHSRLVHVRIRYSYLHYSPSTYKQLRDHLDQWSTFIQDNPSLSLQSIYLDSSLQPFKALPVETQTCLETLTRVCQERKIDLIFETLPINFEVDPYISPEFVRRQKEQRRDEAEGRRV